MISENWPLPTSKEQQMQAGRGGPLTLPSGWQRTHLPGDSQLLWLPYQGSLLAGETDVYLKDKWNWGHTQDPEKQRPASGPSSSPKPTYHFSDLTCLSPFTLSFGEGKEAKRRLTLFQGLLFTLPGNTSAAFPPVCLLLCYCSRFNDWHTRGEKDGSPLYSWAPHILASAPRTGS